MWGGGRGGVRGGGGQRVAGDEAWVCLRGLGWAQRKVHRETVVPRATAKPGEKNRKNNKPLKDKTEDVCSQICYWEILSAVTP